MFICAERQIGRSQGKTGGRLQGVPDGPSRYSFFRGRHSGRVVNWEVNVRDFDVGLHLIFTDQAAHDQYQDVPKHHQFVDENKESWAGVRVFDSVVDGERGV